MTRYTFLGHPVPPALVGKFPDRLTLFDELSGQHVVRMRTARYVGVPRQPKAAAA